jgi:DNA mismatch repair protein MutS
VTFHSVLYERDADRGQRETTPGYFHDLNLERVVERLTSGFEEYDLKPFFQTPLRTVTEIEYRHEVMRDLEDAAVFSCIESFATNMRLVREHLIRAKKFTSAHQSKRWFLQAAETYTVAVHSLRDCLAELQLRSRALNALREFVTTYANSGAFEKLRGCAESVRAGLDAVRYCVLINGNRVTVSRYEPAPDYSALVIGTFSKFAQGADREYRFSVSDYPEMNHVEARILEFVAALHPEEFSALDNFVDNNQGFVDGVLARFDREIHFYIAYLKLSREILEAGLTFCFPSVTTEKMMLCSENGYDLALAIALRQSGNAVVSNDWYLSAPERILVITGPNQGGKTTFARAFGQLHHLAAIGVPVPGTKASVLLFDGMFTHFERGENLTDRHGKLQDDLMRVHEMLSKATPQSIVIINEIFSSTTLRDAVLLAQKVAGQILEAEAICVCVTFLDELASLSESTVSMTSMISADDPATRTFKILRRPADGRAYAISIAERHGLTYDRLKGRIPS